MRRIIIAAFLFLMAGLGLVADALSTHAWADDQDRIAAVVNDEVVTVRDLEERVRMALALSQLKDSVESRKRVVPQVLRKMIDEHLAMQESKRFKMSVSSKEVDENIHFVEKQNNMPEGTLIAELGRIGVSAEALREQFTADITWQRLSIGMYQQTIKVGDDEITERMEAIAAKLGKPEYLVADITLLVDQQSQEEATRNLGERLIEQLKAGAPFPVLASQFSQSASAVSGGNLGWISEDGVDDELFAVIKEMTPGTASKLIRTSDGFHIVALVSRRIAGTGINGAESTITYSKIVLPLPAKDPPPRNVLISKADTLMRGQRSCDAFDAKGKKEGAVSQERIGPLKLASLPQATQSLLMNVPAGEIALPVEDIKGVSVYMMCRREDKSAPLPSREAVRRQIEGERIDLLATRHMRDLRRAAFIDTRL